nr:sulfotransferase [Paenibacillus polymyxa]
MIDKQGGKLVFLLSVPRSGSSLLTAILQNHSRLFATPLPLAYPLMYEQFVANPTLEIEKLCHFLGVHYEPGMERYGNFADTPQSSLFYSMGAGDPFVIEHEQAHQNSVHSWQHLLSTKEIELYTPIPPTKWL